MKNIPIKCKGQRYVSINKLKSFQGNLKELKKDEFEKLKRSILKYGFSFPVFVWKHSILDGHQRLFVVKEMLKEGYEIGDIPIVEIEAKNKTEAAEKLLLLNSRYAHITDEGLYEFLNEYSVDINEISDDLELPDIDIDNFISGYLEEDAGGLTDDDEIPEVDEEPKTKTGDLYALGNHRLLCGDATKKEDVERLMDGKKADMVFTDPPYGLGGYGGRKNMELRGDDLDPQQFYHSIPDAKELYVWGRAENYVHLKFKPRDVIVWVKNNFGLGKGYRGQYEMCFYKGDFNGSDSDVWQIPKDTGYQHPTQKPVLLAERAIKNSNQYSVLDLFLGSGSTLIACEKTNRKCYGMEIDPHYCDVIVKRWEDYTGNKAELIK